MILETKIPELLGQAVFTTQSFNGIWEFREPSGGQEDYMHWTEGIEKLDKRDTGNLYKWLDENAIEKTGGNFIFQGSNGARCTLNCLEIELLTKKVGAPLGRNSFDGSGYKLPFRTKCTYKHKVEVSWQPKELGIPSEISNALELAGYTGNKK